MHLVDLKQLGDETEPRPVETIDVGLALVEPLLQLVTP